MKNRRCLLSVNGTKYKVVFLLPRNKKEERVETMQAPNMKSISTAMQLWVASDMTFEEIRKFVDFIYEYPNS